MSTLIWTNFPYFPMTTKLSISNIYYFLDVIRHKPQLLSGIFKVAPMLLT
jgi:hypothetical protein